MKSLVTGAHVIVGSTDAGPDRAFLRKSSGSTRSMPGTAG